MRSLRMSVNARLVQTLPLPPAAAAMSPDIVAKDKGRRHAVEVQPYS